MPDTAASAVVSATTGRETGTPSRSAWICMHRSLAVTPPLSSTCRASDSLCAAPEMMPSWSRIG
ncbi:hypothetical protein FHS43_001012 [Streptosporangium becharense]|uniref:Uncharacterized protein n=1 Tax=Streptosporangium becharense TaxID=1816182 RepID=A0A7W9IFP1_9ACTN|nr:hypothetical protein [Streptosporangium becharense]MBB5819278.1 hypothetical protein [Streptosporangium becharense]